MNREQSPLPEVVFMAGLMAVYYAVLHLCDYPISSIAPSIVLLVASHFWIRQQQLGWCLRHNRLRPAWTWLLLIPAALAVLVSARSWAAGRGSLVGTAVQLSLVILVPVAEELFFRQVLLQHLERHINRAIGIIVSTLFFAFLHHAQGAFLQMLILGGICAVATCYLRSVGWAIIIHMAWNLIAVLPQSAEQSLLSITAVLCMILITAAMAKWSFHETQNDKRSPCSKACPEGQ